MSRETTPQESLQMERMAVIGGGRMGEAIIGGLLSSGALDSGSVVVAEPDAARRDDLTRRFGIRCTPDGDEAAAGATVVILAVKPQVLQSVASGLSAVLSRTLVVSIAAGWSTARLESLLPRGTAVVRVMPNTPALVGRGMALVSGGSEASPGQVELVRWLFEQVGRAVVIDERHQDAGTAISGSGPAYFALVIDALARAGVSAGLSRDVAQSLAVQTMLGTAHLIEDTGMHPGQLIDGVASPGGTTIAALDRLEAGGVRAAFAEAVTAAVARAKELGS
jgi:pyrroline-5-carboxylate reductase